ncbi:MAG: hypothetical protein AB8H80_20065 [Planctomycetota bacterium]
MEEPKYRLRSLLAAALCSSLALAQQTLVVPTTFPTIPETVAAATPGDTVLCLSSSYSSSLTSDKGIHLVGQARS